MAFSSFILQLSSIKVLLHCNIPIISDDARTDSSYLISVKKKNTMIQRANIKFCFRLNKTAFETYEIIKMVYGSETYGRATVFRRFSKFRDSREDLEDDQHKGQPKTTHSVANIEKVRSDQIQPVCVCKAHRRVYRFLKKHRP